MAPKTYVLEIGQHTVEVEAKSASQAKTRAAAIVFEKYGMDQTAFFRNLASLRVKK